MSEDYVRFCVCDVLEKSVSGVDFQTEIICRHSELSCGLYLTAWTKLSAIRPQTLKTHLTKKCVKRSYRPVKLVCHQMLSFKRSRFCHTPPEC